MTDNKQIGIFYFVIFLLVIFLFLFWFLFLRNKWQQEEVSVIDLQPYQVVQEIPPQETLIEPVFVQAPKDIIVVEEVVVPVKNVFEGNRGYVIKDGQSTYRPIVENQDKALRVDSF